ncbi:MAG: outer membrane beta-barrel family protein [Muribaculaceae bacterium]|nr:outer membrane beta-barrel family protein [Muribaculaceae bacterium]MDE7080300.1 outer membrane beta-barrel family protein [Muribaculaceae bacterium]
MKRLKVKISDIRMASAALLGCGVLCSVPAVMAKEVVVMGREDRGLLGSVAITMYAAEKDSIGAALTNECGRAEIMAEARYVRAQHDDYVPAFVELTDAQVDTVRLQPVTQIDELVVNASGIPDHYTYVIPREDMKRYATFYEALNEIPNLVVLHNSDQLFYEGSGNVKLLLNGVETTVQELQALDKDDVLKVNAYPLAPPRFMIQGYTSAIDVITKSNLTGGNAAINIWQSFYPLWGQNSASLFYNYKRSRFSAIYSNHNWHSHKNRQSEFLDYEFDGVKYYKHKEGLDSPGHNDENSLSLGFQNNLAGSYLYSVTLNAGINKEESELRQLVSSQSNPDPYEALNTLYTDVKSFSIDNYFEKTLGDGGKYGQFMADVVWQRHNSSYRSGYREFETSDVLPTVDVMSAYRIRYDALIGQLYYTSPQFSWGMISCTVWNSYNHSRYKESVISTTENTNSFMALAQYYGSKGKFVYIAQLGVQHQYTDVSIASGTHSRWQPRPLVGVWYYPTSSLRLQLQYSYSSGLPTIAQLSQTDKWIDTRLVFHGNANLRPYSQHTVSAGGVYNSRYVEGSLSVSYSSAPGLICEHFVTTPDYMLQTLINLDAYRNLQGNVSLVIKPLGSNVWKIVNSVVLGMLDGRSPDYDWKGYRFQWMPYTAVNLDKWTFSARYQYPGKYTMGQMVYPRMETWSIGASFRPKESISLGVEISQPFGHGSRESQRTVASSPVQENIESFSPDRANSVRFTFSWNVSFGKNQNRQSQQLSNGTQDDGILRR